MSIRGTLRVRRAAIASVPALSLLILCAWPGDVGSAAGESPRLPGKSPLRVICVTEWVPPTGAYRTKPRRCVFHRRGVFPLAGYNTYSMVKLRWKQWGPRKARGKGKLGVSTVGLVKTKVDLRKPRTRCGERVFTVLRMRYKIKHAGKVHRFKGKVPLDNCLV